ncbi:MAG: histidine kinase dimerization/phospho-acceptor domain-containing protein [bacterium]
MGNEDLSSGKSDLLSEMWHEVRNPLTTIKAFTQLLLSAPDGEIKSRVEYLKIINSEIDRLTGLIDELSDTAKLTKESQTCLGK